LLFLSFSPKKRRKRGKKRTPQDSDVKTIPERKEGKKKKEGVSYNFLSLPKKGRGRGEEKKKNLIFQNGARRSLFFLFFHGREGKKGETRVLFWPSFFLPPQRRKGEKEGKERKKGRRRETIQMDYLLRR